LLSIRPKKRKNRKREVKRQKKKRKERKRKTKKNKEDPPNRKRAKKKKAMGLVIQGLLQTRSSGGSCCQLGSSIVDLAQLSAAFVPFGPASPCSSSNRLSIICLRSSPPRSAHQKICSRAISASEAVRRGNPYSESGLDFLERPRGAAAMPSSMTSNALAGFLIRSTVREMSVYIWLIALVSGGSAVVACHASQ